MVELEKLTFDYLTVKGRCLIMKRYIQHIIYSTEEKTRQFIKEQIQDLKRRDFGGLPQKLVDVKPTVYGLSSVISVYCCEQSHYYKDQQLLMPIQQALSFIEREQRPDGTFDYPSCNFLSAPDTAFCLKHLIPAYQLLLKFSDESEHIDIKEHYFRIIKKALIGVKNGGFHTPNHRWAIAAALMQGYNIIREEPLRFELKEKAQQYLSEGIDGNEDGEYAERSTGNYNAVVNSALITLYEETGDEVYLGYVKRNLKMMLNYFDPDDTIFTENSTRQDQGTQEYGHKYFYQFLYMADYEVLPEFDCAAHKIIADNKQRVAESPLCLFKLMLNERLITHQFEGYGFLENYRKHFTHSGVVRYRKGDFSYSILKGKKKFLFLKMKNRQVVVKVGISYCDIRSFVVQEIERTKVGYQLKFKTEAWYYKPFNTEQNTSDWWEMDHTKRDLLKNTTLEVIINIEECENGLDLKIETKGCDKIPIRVEIMVPNEGELETDGFAMEARAGEQIILKSDRIRVEYPEVCYQIGRGFGEHKFTGHYSGEEVERENFTIIMTDYTPVNRTIELRAE